jgi:CheY-like chemotaxis protein
VLRGLKALVADDNEVNVLVISGFLRSWGVEVDVATNGRQAIEHIQERDYGLVLMDLRMPELDGYAATRQIRSQSDARLTRLPILAISASIRMGHQHELEAAGFTDFVGKPIDPDVLFAKIVRCVS